MTVTGADALALRSLGNALRDGGASLERIAGDMDGLVGRLVWSGPDADGFCASWSGQLRGLLVATAARVIEAGARLELDAVEQEDASRAGTAFLGGGPRGLTPLDITVQWGDVWQWVKDAFGFLTGPFSTLETAAGAVVDWLIDTGRMAGPFFKGLSKVLTPLGRALSVLGAISGVAEFVTGLDEGDPYHCVDGAISVVLNGGTLLSKNPYVAAAAVVWGIAKFASGDVPVSKRVADASVVTHEFLDRHPYLRAITLNPLTAGPFAVMDGLGWVLTR